MNIIYKKVLDLLHYSISAESGDGSGIWLAKFISLSDLIPLIQEYNIENNLDWIVILNKNTLSWGIGQEWVIITNEEEEFALQVKSGFHNIHINY